MATVVVAIDQITKSLAVSRLSDGPVSLFWTLRLNLAFNSGLAFSQGRGLTPYITVLAAVLLVGLVIFSRRVTRPIAAAAVGLMIGGASGNLADRLFRPNGGAVIDFIDFQWWPVFNVADIAINAGAILLVIATFREQSPSAGPEG